MEIMFETSAGICKGKITDTNEVVFTEKSLKKLQSLYNIDFAYVIGKWLKIRLIDSIHGDPEYRIVYID